MTTAAEPARRRVFLGLGSNLGDRQQFLRAALAALPDLVRISQVYETEPVGGPDKQGPYLNLVAELNSPDSPRELLELARSLESAAGRVRAERWGPRTLDVDLLWIEGVALDQPDLQVPHPRMWERAFVLAPLAELAPDLVGADWEKRATGRVWPVGAL